ncbi:Gfo/Idh/MocA family oxidoreductase [Candidatus Poribacteria bacterium]|nr:Gfo/Idh/MocA family oxidoreductase [Candidatus Poribacteria bacterium]MBT5710548.1 Gfo/Idh/MocA family oxidoreductase [Candidatus Poribacteria bacterium]MBT7096037.1 Gfo/Idh/MocA family oxidoreductase [Candidatus Poribacteria bacterium]MBT7805190.1 Gfo/Idh/MocA family oxidoreductase [Candidatus Poribacteria bacterium]
MKQARYGIGVVGLGIGQQHLEGYRRKGLRVAAICDLDDALRTRTAEKFGVGATYANVYDMIADPAVDVVDVALQPWQRLPVVEAAAEAGKHVLSQKPFAMSMRQGVAMVEACERHGVLLMVNQNSCYVPGFLAVEPYLESLGDVYHMSITCDGRFMDFPERRLIPAMMVHHVALAVHWFGKMERVYCHAHGHDLPVAEREVMAQALVRFGTGVGGLLSCNWSFLGAAGHTHQHPHEEIRVQGSHGSICGHSGEMSVHIEDPEPRTISPDIEGTWFPDAFGNSMSHFLACIDRGSTPKTDGRGNLHVLQCLFAMHRSATERREVCVSDIGLDDDIDLSPHRVLGADER